ncbi:MAG: pyridoxamine 5'-phosphate oxidase family protein [Acidimicrobiia bacterium]
MTATTLTQFKRHPERGSHDRAIIDAILDTALVAHVAFLRHGKPSVIPTLAVRLDDEVIIHGSPASALLRAAKAGTDLCLTVTHIDGLVLARSAFNHSANYRSVLVYGRGRWLEGDEKLAAMEALVEKIAPGRLPHLRPLTRNEIAGTAVVAIALTDASAKVRRGQPVDEDADYALPIWAGVVPIETRLGAPTSDPRNLAGVGLPDHVAALSW